MSLDALMVHLTFPETTSFTAPQSRRRIICVLAQFLSLSENFIISVDQSPWEASSHGSTQKNPHLLWIFLIVAYHLYVLQSIIFCTVDAICITAVAGHCRGR
jgi:hypothetical protein